MQTHPDDPHSLDLASPWQATHAAIERTMQPTSPRGGRATLIETLVHPTYPFVAAALAGGAGLPAGLRGLANNYLDRVLASVGGDMTQFARSHWSEASIPWDWHDLTWGTDVRDAKPLDARLSFAVEVDAVAGAGRTVVLLAGPQWRTETGAQMATGGAEGLRVILQVGPPDEAGNHFVRITGSSFAAPPRPRTRIDPRLQIEALAGRIRDRAGADYAVHELAALASGVFRVAGNALAGTGTSPRVIAFALRLSVDAGDGDGVGEEYRVELLSHAAPVKAFGNDPASRGPSGDAVKRRASRDEDRLAAFLHDATRLPPAKPGPGPGEWHHELQDPPMHPLITVQGTALAQNTYDPAVLPQRIPAKGLALRSDDEAAAHAFLRGAELMDRLRDSGLSPHAYFKYAKLPLILRHHAAMRNGNPDGHSVNAQVRPLGAGLNLQEAYDPAKLPALEVRFGAANLSHRHAQEAYHGRPRPQYMGLAADRRWAWHEFGHVLSYASTNALEFAFAHSAGDALAAILNDPDSRLLCKTATSAMQRNAPARGLTFPWVPIKRRHDRDAALGWCWCGRRNTRRISPLPPGARVFTGYFAEQLLSTTMFRLYRVLGGDTFGNHDLRHKAADYTAYLIMKAIDLLGPHTKVAATQAAHFHDALVQADTGTHTWQYAGRASTAGTRIGGMAVKAIRWAFEQQGLFATESATDVVEGVGQPPEVDVHIFGDGSDADGGYGPHALDWVEVIRLPAPAWHASPLGMSIQAGELKVKVRNRGTACAHAVSVMAWAAPAVPGALGWTGLNLAPTSPASGDIGPRGFMTFSFQANLAPGRYFLAAAAGCAADRALLDPLSGQPCAGNPQNVQPPSDRRHVVELVAGDNNMGLVLVEVPAP